MIPLKTLPILPLLHYLSTEGAHRHTGLSVVLGRHTGHTGTNGVSGVLVINNANKIIISICIILNNTVKKLIFQSEMEVQCQCIIHLTPYLAQLCPAGSLGELICCL
jgi:hypothetical protein